MTPCTLYSTSSLQVSLGSCSWSMLSLVYCRATEMLVKAAYRHPLLVMSPGVCEGGGGYLFPGDTGAGLQQPPHVREGRRATILNRVNIINSKIKTLQNHCCESGAIYFG